VFPSDLPGVNPATLNGMILYYRLMTKRSGLGDSTELSRVGLSYYPSTRLLEDIIIFWMRDVISGGNANSCGTLFLSVPLVRTIKIRQLSSGATFIAS
jgi:hypothetical protein